MSMSYSLSLSLTQLPREIIYKVAAGDASVYNCILRLCRTMISLFPLSIRLDFMISFGVTVRIYRDTRYIACIVWNYNNVLHDVWGAAVQRHHGEREYYWHGREHRRDGPAMVSRKYIAWHHHCLYHRDLEAPSGTGVEWLRGAAKICVYSDGARIMWFTMGELIRIVTPADAADMAQVRAEMDYWLARECT
jgi:hypothetical protein